MGAGARENARAGRKAAAALSDGESGPAVGQVVGPAAGPVDGPADGPVADVLAGYGPEAWTAFDEEVRARARSWYRPPAADRIEARLCAPDGRVREGALIASDDPVPELVLIRCADWAPPVRERARRILLRIVAGDPAGHLVRLTPLALRLGRREHGVWALELFEGALREEPGALAALRDGTDLPARRLAARLAVAAGGTGVRELARQAARELDPAAAQLWTDAALRTMATAGPDDVVVDTLLGGRLPMVRAAGVTALRGAGRADEAARHLGRLFRILPGLRALAPRAGRRGPLRDLPRADQGPRAALPVRGDRLLRVREAGGRTAAAEPARPPGRVGPGRRPGRSAPAGGLHRRRGPDPAAGRPVARRGPGGRAQPAPRGRQTGPAPPRRSDRAREARARPPGRLPAAPRTTRDPRAAGRGGPDGRPRPRPRAAAGTGRPPCAPRRRTGPSRPGSSGGPRTSSTTTNWGCAAPGSVSPAETR